MKYVIKNNRDFKKIAVSLEVLINNIENLKEGEVIEVKKLKTSKELRKEYLKTIKPRDKKKIMRKVSKRLNKI